MTYRELQSTVKSSEAHLSLDDYYWVGVEYVDGLPFHKYYLLPQIDNLARFLCSNSNDKLVSSDNELPVLSTRGKRIEEINADIRIISKISAKMEIYQNLDTVPAFRFIE